MFREPWFEILEVWEDRGRSMPDIVRDCVREHHVSIKEMRGPDQSRRVTQAKRQTVAAISAERPDLSSGKIALFFHREPSSIRKLLTKIKRGR